MTRQSRDRRSFTGRFGSGEWWTGERVATDDAAQIAPDQSTPRAVMRAFLTAANQRADGNFEAIDAAGEGWRRTGDLPFPDFEWQTKAELSGSLDFPP